MTKAGVELEATGELKTRVKGLRGYEGPLKVGDVVAIRYFDKVQNRFMVKFPSLAFIKSKEKFVSHVTLIRWVGKLATGEAAAVNGSTVSPHMRRSSSLGREKASNQGTHRRSVSWGSDGSVAFGFDSPPSKSGGR